MLLKVLDFFVKIRSNRVLLISLVGRDYDDSPRALYEYMKKFGFSDV